jgi:hypothetical protein
LRKWRIKKVIEPCVERTLLSAAFDFDFDLAILMSPLPVPCDVDFDFDRFDLEWHLI